MNTQHTPGRWIVAKRPVGKRQTTVVLDADHNEVCEAYASPALISAAPELLAALHGIVSNHGLRASLLRDGFGQQLDAARAAIAKATGQ